MLIEKDFEEVDMVNNPPHYALHKYETIDVICDICHDNGREYCLGNVIKYISRYRNKNGVQDLEKANWYLNKLINIERSFIDVD